MLEACRLSTPSMSQMQKVQLLQLSLLANRKLIQPRIADPAMRPWAPNLVASAHRFICSTNRYMLLRIPEQPARYNKALANYVGRRRTPTMQEMKIWKHSRA